MFWLKPFAGPTLADTRNRRITGINILAIKRMIASPSPCIILEAKDRLGVFGTRSQLKELEGST
jgi:K+/H+ antiporter YhaU regulatory subunit KhtT